MPQQKLTIVLVTLLPDSKNSLPSTSSKGPSTSICKIKIANAEITFNGGVNEHDIPTVKRELKNL